MLDREPDGELKLDLDGKLVVPNIIELTCIKQYTVLKCSSSQRHIGCNIADSVIVRKIVRRHMKLIDPEA